MSRDTCMIQSKIKDFISAHSENFINLIDNFQKKFYFSRAHFLTAPLRVPFEVY